MKSPAANRRVRPIIRVFVSSTFSDLVFERNALQQHVWPLLEQLCLKHGFQFHAIDLRWGVSTEAGLDHRTMRICFEELRRSQEISPEPNFLILLGNRYGWRPLPEEISQEEFDRLVIAAKSGGGGRQPLPGTHGKSAEDVLNEWYRCDQNVLVPTDPVAVHDRSPLNYILQPRTQHLGDGRDYTRTTEPRPADTQDWLDVQQVLWSIINTAFAATDAGSTESGTTFEHRFDDIDWPRHIAEVHAREHPKRAVPQIVRFQGSATEQEIWCGTLSEPKARQHVLAFVREIDNLPTAPRLGGLKNFVDLAPAGQIDPAAQQALSRLKQALHDRLGKNYVETGAAQLIAPVDEHKRPIIDHDQEPTIGITTNHIEPFWKDVLARLTPLVQKQIDDYWRQTNLPDTESRQPAAEQRTARELEIERDEHLRFGRERGPKAAFVGRKDQLQRILDYVNGNSSQPLVIHGASGCGKTALLARAVEDIPAAKQPIVRFIGVTPRSSDLRSLLRSLCLEFRQRFEKGADPLEGTTPGAGLPPFQTPLPSDIRELIDEFRKHLQAATAEQPVILFLDALDQLAETDNGRQLFWIPFGQLPSHVKIVVSCLSDRDEKDPVAQPFIALQRRKLPAENMISLNALSQDEAKTLLFNRWLPAIGRTVAKSQRHHIEQRLESEACRQPLYLKLLFEEVKLWRWYDEPTKNSSTNREDEAPTEPQATELGDGVSALLEQIFDRLSRPEHHGESLVKFVLGYITAARYGLSETEILEVLFADTDYKEKLDETSRLNNHTLPSEPRRIPIAIWSRLRSDLAPYLTERAAYGSNVLTFYHRQVAQYVSDKCLAMPSQRRNWHKQLAGYFRGQLDPENNQSWNGVSPRAFMELPFHLENAGQVMRESWFRILSQLQFAQAKCQLRLAYDLVADLDLALSEARGTAQWRSLFQLRYAVWNQAAGLQQIPSLSRQQLALRILDYAIPDSELVGQARAILANRTAAEQKWPYPYLPEHARSAAEQVKLYSLPHVHAIALHNEHVIAFCADNRWRELNADGALLQEGALTQEYHLAAGGGGRIVASLGRFGFVWNEWPAQQPHAQFTTSDDVTLLACSEKGDEILVASRDGSWAVLAHGLNGKWNLSGKSHSHAKALAAAPLAEKQWGVVTADGAIHIGAGKQWSIVAIPCRELTAACLDQTGKRVVVSEKGKITVLDLGGDIIHMRPSVAQNIKCLRLGSENAVLALTEAGHILQYPFDQTAPATTLVSGEHQFSDTVVFRDDHHAIAVDYLGKTTLFCTSRPDPDLAVRELPVAEQIRALGLDDECHRIHGVGATGGRFMLEASSEGWSATVLEPIPIRVSQAWFRDINTVISSENYNAASSLYEHRCSTDGTVHTRRVWPALGTSERYRSISGCAISGGGTALAISNNCFDSGGNDVLVFDTLRWRIISRTSFDKHNAVDRVVPDDTGKLVVATHMKLLHALTLIRNGKITQLPLEGGVRRVMDAQWSPFIGDIDVSADGSRLITIQSDGIAYLAHTNIPHRESCSPLGNGVQWCRLSACGEFALLGRDERNVEVISLASPAHPRSLCLFFAPFRIDWAQIFASRRVVLLGAQGAVWGIRFASSPNTNEECTAVQS